MCEHDDCVVQDRSSPLHWACRLGHESIVETLLNRGADVNAVAKVRWRGRDRGGKSWERIVILREGERE